MSLALLGHSLPAGLRLSSGWIQVALSWAAETDVWVWSLPGDQSSSIGFVHDYLLARAARMWGTRRNELLFALCSCDFHGIYGMHHLLKSFSPGVLDWTGSSLCTQLAESVILSQCGKQMPLLFWPFWKHTSWSLISCWDCGSLIISNIVATFSDESAGTYRAPMKSRWEPGARSWQFYQA